ncbi:MAG: lipase family protein [Bacteroidales bacterium]|nr:lipase family protein [Bacteroidales bacterium]MDD4671211.1 lipase family protein [Bacteroidales bacterium]
MNTSHIRTNRKSRKWNTLISSFLLIIVLAASYSCTKHDPDDGKLLVNSSSIAEYNLNQISDIVEQNTGYRIEDVVSIISQSVGSDLFETYLKLMSAKVLCFDRIVYKNVDENCSALVIYPKGATLGKMLLGMHPTIGKADEAPTKSLFSGEILFAYLDICVVIPDYIGFGESENKTHPYLHVESTAEDAINAVLACREYFSQVKKMDIGRSLYISGYSEGGGNALAVQKVAERDHSASISLKKVYCGGAPCDLVETFNYVIANDNSDYPYGIAMVPIGLDAGDKLNLDFSKIFSGKLAANYKEWILSKKYHTYQVNDFIGSTSIKDYMHPDLFTAEGNSEINKLKKSIADNSLVNGWTPIAPIFMVHGTADMTVPYINAVNAFNSFKSKGCNITLMPADNCDHSKAFFYYLYHVFLNLIQNTSASE